MGKTQGSGSRTFRPKLISLAVASCFVTTTAFANPTGHQVVSGQVSVIQGLLNGKPLLQVTNSPNAIINWQSFSIGANEITRFIQQSQSSAVLNRVGVGALPSQILGTLQSRLSDGVTRGGRVFLINPNGIVFGAGAQIDVGGLVASSLNLSNEDFLANRLKFTDMPGAGSVINQGNITTGSGGNVYLVGSAVTNNGIITSPQGEVVLAAGNSVELVNPGTPNLRVEVNAQDEEARNIGQIIADAGRVGIYAGLINNSGTVRASSAVAEGGRILLKATKEVTLESSSILDASGAGGGTIEVLAKNGGTAHINGRLDVSAPVSGDGGFIETSADKVKIADGTVIRAGSANGKDGLWLIDPPDFRIGEDISGLALSATLSDGGVDVIITSEQGAYGDSSSVYVDDTVSWDSANSLTLVARQDVFVNNPITNAGTGDINLYAGWNNDAFDTIPVIISGVGSIQMDDSSLSTGGNVLLVAGNGIFGNSLSPITANGLLADGGAGVVHLDSATNSVNTIAGRAGGDFYFRNGKALTVETVASRSGIEVTAGPGGSAIVDIDVNGTVTISNSVVSATGAANALPWDVSGGSASVVVNATGGSIVIDGSGSLTAKGGDAGIASYGGSVSADGGSASVSLIAANGIVVNGSVSATGGNGGGATATADGFASAQGGQGAVHLNANSGGVMGSGSLSATGGVGGTATTSGVTYSADADGGRGAVSVYSNGGSIALTGSISVTGGAGGDASGEYASARGGDGDVNINNDGNADVSLNGVSAAGGAGGTASDALYSSAADGGEGSIYVSTPGTLSIGGNLVATGGNAGTANSSDGYAYSYGGWGEVRLQAGAGGVNGSGSLSATGGAGGTATASGATYSAYADGGQGDVSVYSDNGGSIALTGSVSATGGAGGSNANGYDAYARGGDGFVYMYSDTGNVSLGGVNATGGVGGAASGTGYASADGGEGYVSAHASGSLSTNGNIFATGGNAGTANSSDGYAYSYGGRGEVYLEAGAAGVSGSGSLSATGGAGGTATTSGATYSAYADGGQGYVSVESYNGGSIALTGSVSVTGGAGGNASGEYAYARGGYVDVYIDDNNGNAGVSLNNGVSAAGGAGGTASGVLYSSAVDGGEGYIYVLGGNVTISNSTLTATGGSASSGWGGDAWIDVYAYGVGGVSITDSTLQATGGAGAAPNQQGYANILIGTGQVSGNVAINNSTVKATGLEASVYVNSSGNITASNSTVTATARTGADGGEGSVSFYAWSSGATIDTGSSTLAAVGRTSADGGEGCCFSTGVSMQAGGNVTLGLLSSSEFVSVNSISGGIIDGNGADTNAIAPFVTLVGSTGIGSLADRLETTTGSLYVSAYGGEIGVTNTGTGSLVLANLSNSGAGANAVGTSGTMVFSQSIDVSGNLELTADNGMVVEENIFSGGDLTLGAGAGDLGFDGVSVHGNNVTLSGKTVQVGFLDASTMATEVVASNLMKVTTSANLNVLGGADSEANALLAGMDVDLTVGTVSGFVNIHGGSNGASARISAGSPTSIHLTFPNLVSGGYFVDGAEGAVTSGDTGFFAAGAPAVLGQNLIVTYALTPTPTSPTPPPDETDEPPPGIDDAINQVIAATNNQTGLPGKDLEINTLDGEEKKELSVCK